MMDKTTSLKIGTYSFFIPEKDLSNQYNPDCGLCSLSEVESGKDQLLYIDSYCYIIKNGNTHLKTSAGLRFAQRRLSLTLRRHCSSISQAEEEYVRKLFSSFISEFMHLREGRDFIFAITMGTYSQHWHIHAYFPPWRKKIKYEIGAEVFLEKQEYQNKIDVMRL